MEDNNFDVFSAPASEDFQFQPAETPVEQNDAAPVGGAKAFPVKLLALAGAAIVAVVLIIVLLSSFGNSYKTPIKTAEKLLNTKSLSKIIDKAPTLLNGFGESEAKKVLKTLETKESKYHPIYELDLPLADKIRTIAKEVYGAGSVSFGAGVEKQLRTLEEQGFGNLPVCIAKTQYSLSDDQKKLGRPDGFEMSVREVYVSAGAGFVVALTGTIIPMPGLPKEPAALRIDVDQDGVISGLF